MRLWTRRTVWRPTAAGYLLVVAVLAVFSCAMLAGLYPFLAVNRPLDAGVLIVEGWVPDYALAAVFEALDVAPRSLVVVTGGPIETGGHFHAFGNWAEVTRERLAREGAPVGLLTAVPYAQTRKDRTLSAAHAVRAHLASLPRVPEKVDVLTMAPHARRTRLLFRRALEPDIEVGIIPVENALFGPSDWWRGSAGVRTLVSETLAYAYARLYPWQRAAAITP